MLNLKEWVAHVSNALKADYVVEEGKPTGVSPAPSDGWYRKWNSGKIKYWYRWYMGSGMTTSVWQAPIYYRDIDTFKNMWKGYMDGGIVSAQVTSMHSQFIAKTERSKNR